MLCLIRLYNGICSSAMFLKQCLTCCCFYWYTDELFSDIAVRNSSDFRKWLHSVFTVKVSLTFIMLHVRRFVRWNCLKTDFPLFLVIDSRARRVQLWLFHLGVCQSIISSIPKYVLYIVCKGYWTGVWDLHQNVAGKCYNVCVTL